MVHDDGVAHVLIEHQSADDIVSHNGMRLYQSKFFGSQFPGFPQDRIGELQLSDIIVESAENQDTLGRVIHGDPVPDDTGQQRRAEAMREGQFVLVGNHIVQIIQ